MTPLLWPDWLAAIFDSLSTTTNRSRGQRPRRSRAVAKPTIPAPTTTTSIQPRPPVDRFYHGGRTPSGAHQGDRVGPADSETYGWRRPARAASTSVAEYATSISRPCA